MACNGVLTPLPPPAKVTPPPVLKLFTPHLRLEMATSAFLTHGYFQKADVHISVAITN